MREPDLYHSALTKAIIAKHDFVIQKKYGQNFLIDGRVLQKIVDAAEITKEDFILEIGPGIGTLTQFLAWKGGKVCAVEIDRKLIGVLQETLADFENTEVIHNDILKMDLKALIEEKSDGRPVKVVANLPYYITTPVIMQLLEQALPIKSITVMIQKEVALRMSAAPATSAYGSLSLAVQYYAKPYLAANVPQNCFFPRPNVDSAVIRLEKYKEPPVTVKDEALMFRLIRAGFQQRRKTLANSIANVAGLGLKKETIISVIEGKGHDAGIRGETLSLADFAKLSDAFYAMLN